MKCKNKNCDDIGVIEKDGGDWEDMMTSINFASQEWKEKYL